MATRTNTPAPATPPVSETPAVEESTAVTPAAAAPVKPSGFNLPRVVAKAPKPVEPVAEKVAYASGASVTLSGVSRVPSEPVVKKQIVVDSLRNIGR